MGANEKHAATYHGGERTPDTEEVENSYTMDQVQTSLRKSTVVAREEFRRWLETVRAEAKAEALREAASAYPVMLRDMVSRGSVADWLHGRAEEKEQFVQDHHRRNKT